MSGSASLASQTGSARSWDTPSVITSFAGHFHGSATAATVYKCDDISFTYSLDRGVGAFSIENYSWAMTLPTAHSATTGALTGSGHAWPGSGGVDRFLMPISLSPSAETWNLSRGRWVFSATTYINPLLYNDDSPTPHAGVDYICELLFLSQRVITLGGDQRRVGWTKRVAFGTNTTSNIIVDLRACALWEGSFVLLLDPTGNNAFFPASTHAFDVTLTGARLTTP